MESSQFCLTWRIQSAYYFENLALFYQNYIFRQFQVASSSLPLSASCDSSFSFYSYFYYSYSGTDIIYLNSVLRRSEFLFRNCLILAKITLNLCIKSLETSIIANVKFTKNPKPINASNIKPKQQRFYRSTIQGLTVSYII